MKIRDFKLECYFGRYEFTAPYLLTQSDCEAMTVEELLALEPGAEEGLFKTRLGYTETWGDPELRELIAALYEDMRPENVLTFHGAQEAVFAYMNVMLEPGDHMIALFPNYQSLYEVAQSVPGCRLSLWHLKDNGEEWTLDWDELESLIEPRTKLIALSSPNNPTGVTLTNAEIERLCALCRSRGIALFADEVYKGLELDGETRHWMADRYEACTSLGVMSKAYGLAGLRIGWLVSRDTELLDRIVRFKHYMSICSSAPSEFLAKTALRHGEELLARSRRLIASNIEIADAFFERLPQVFSKRPIKAGPVAFHKLLTDLSADAFCRMAVEKKGVLMLPASIYDMDAPYFRMGYGRRGVPEALQKLEEFLHENGFA